MEVTKQVIQLVTNYDASALTDNDFQTLANIALARLQILLCDPDLTLENLPAGLLAPFGDLFVWTATNNPQDSGIKSETAENYSYSRSDTDADANYLVRLRDKYGDIIEDYSKCEGKDGIVENASANPLWTPDYYWEQDV